MQFLAVNDKNASLSWWAEKEYADGMATAIPSDKGPRPSSFLADPSAKRGRINSDRVRDLAARLFAELFYYQVMKEREAKLKKQSKGKKD